MRSVFRSGFGQNSTRELGKHRVVPKHPQKPLFCTHTVIFGSKSGNLGNVSPSLNEVLRKRQLLPPHELEEVSRYLKRSGWPRMGRRGKGVLGRLPSSVCALSPSHMM